MGKIIHGYNLQGKQHPINKCWNQMKYRCNNPKCKSYKDYGGRGIKVCDRWNVFENFLKDMLPTWKLGLSLDRIDNDKEYSPKNCRWATTKEQQNNRKITTKYKNMYASEQSIVLGGDRNLIGDRLRRGWNIEKAFTTPKNLNSTIK